MKTLADIKRAIKTGGKITLTNASVEKMQKYIGIESTITKTQTNGFYVDRDGRNSWIEYGKANQYTVTADGFRYDFNGGFLEYKI